MSTPDEKMVQKPSNRAGIWVAVAVVLIVVILVVVGAYAGWFGTKSTNNSPGTTCPGSPGCTNATACTPPPSQSLLGAGSTFVSPLMFQWETAYTASQVTYSAVGSGAGITQLGAKTVDYGASDAPLSPAQQATDPGVVTIPETAGAVAIIYSVQGIGTHLMFNGSALAEIFLGQLTNWNNSVLQALNPGVVLPNLAIVVVHRSDGSGTTFAFSEYLSRESSTWNTQVGFGTSINFPTGTGEKGSSALSSYVQETNGAIGYVDLEFALQSEINFGLVENPTGTFVLPSLTSAQAAVTAGAGALPVGNSAPSWYNVSLLNEPGNQTYPISTFSYLLVYQDLSGAFGSSYSLQKAEGLVNFLNWTIHAGQSYSALLYYVPLPANVVTANEASLNLVTYNGQPIPECTG